MILQLKSRQSNSIVTFSHEDFNVKWKFFSFFYLYNVYGGGMMHHAAAGALRGN